MGWVTGLSWVDPMVNSMGLPPCSLGLAEGTLSGNFFGVGLAGVEEILDGLVPVLGTSLLEVREGEGMEEVLDVEVGVTPCPWQHTRTINASNTKLNLSILLADE